MEIICTTRKFGKSSIGVIIPKEIAKKQKIGLNEQVVINVERKADLRDVFGTWKTKTSAQKLKNIARIGWQ